MEKEEKETEAINMMEYLLVVLRWKRDILIILSVVTLYFIIHSYCLPITYQSSAVLLPMGGGRGGLGASSMVGQMNFSSLLTGGGPNNQLVVMLKSRTLAELMIRKYDLLKVLYPKIWDNINQKWKVDHPETLIDEDAVNTLLSKVSFSENKKDQTIIITTEFESPELAAKVANEYTAELQNYVNDNAVTVAKRNRIFVESQLERNKTELLELGKDLTTFYRSNNVSNVETTIDIDVSVKHAPKPMIGGDLLLEDINSRSEELKQEIEKMKIVKGVPQQVYLQYLTMRRDLLGQLNTLLNQQYEMAKIEESKEDLFFQVIDKGRVPKTRFQPKRRKIVMRGFVVALIVSIFYAFSREYLNKIKVLKSS